MNNLQNGGEMMPEANSTNGLSRGESHVKAMAAAIPGSVLEATWQTEDQVTVDVPTEKLPECVEFMYYNRGGWIPDMVVNDERHLNGYFRLYYLMSMEEEDKCYLTVRTKVDPITREFPSVTPRVPACVWSEREAYDMMGLKAVGLPDARRLVLPDDWPDGLHPLLKDSMDYRHRPEPAVDVENYEFLDESGVEDPTEIPMGPLHITSDEPGHFRLFCEGENIVDADYRLFYAHRGMEKVAEARMTYDQIPFLSDRICGICGFAHSVAYVQTIENAMGIEIPKRAEYLRAIFLEVERLHSHLLNLGLVCHYCGFDTGFMHFFRVREKAMDLAQLLTGARKTYGMNLIGGVRRDILEDHRKATLKLVGELREEVTRLVSMLTTTPNFESRTKGVGHLDRKVCRDFSPVGPMVRGSGFARDVRFDHPFSGYKYIEGLKAHSADSCDVFGRTTVRIGEFLDSITMIEQLVNGLPSGPILTQDFKYEPGKFAMGFTEAPRGEDMHWSMTGDNQKVYRWRAKAATYSNWPVLRYALQGNTVSDAAVIIGSMDPCYSCTDRVTICDVKSHKEKTISKQQLEDYAANRKHSPLKD